MINFTNKNSSRSDDDLSVDIQFERAFMEYYEQLYYFARSFINNSEESKDIVNNVYELLWKKRNIYYFSSSLKPLLYKLVHNEVKDYFRHKKVIDKYQSYQLKMLNDSIIPDYNDYDIELRQIMTIISNLSPQTKIVFTKCFIEGKSYKEVESELGVSVNTVKTHITKALKILREGVKNDNRENK